MPFWKKTKAKDHWCVYCLLHDQVFVEAEHLMLDEYTGKIMLVCKSRHEEMMKPEGFQYDFYLN